MARGQREDERRRPRFVLDSGFQPPGTIWLGASVAF
jgi:hypothetical protein